MVIADVLLHDGLPVATTWQQAVELLEAAGLEVPETIRVDLPTGWTMTLSATSSHLSRTPEPRSPARPGVSAQRPELRFQPLSTDVIAARLVTCHACEFHVVRTDYCRACGCTDSTTRRARSPWGTCVLQKWDPSLTPSQVPHAGTDARSPS